MRCWHLRVQISGSGWCELPRGQWQLQRAWCSAKKTGRLAWQRVLLMRRVEYEQGSGERRWEEGRALMGEVWAVGRAAGCSETRCQTEDIYCESRAACHQRVWQLRTTAPAIRDRQQKNTLTGCVAHKGYKCWQGRWRVQRRTAKLLQASACTANDLVRAKRGEGRENSHNRWPQWHSWW